MAINTEDWLLTKPAGMMFLAKFMKDNWRRLMSTVTGRAIFDEIVKEVPRSPVVVEISSDGYVRVYADRAAVKIVLPIKVDHISDVEMQKQAEIMVEDLCRETLKREHKEIYLNQKFLCATGYLSHFTPKQFQKKCEEERILRELGEIGCE